MSYHEWGQGGLLALPSLTDPAQHWTIDTGDEVLTLGVGLDWVIGQERPLVIGYPDVFYNTKKLLTAKKLMSLNSLSRWTVS